MDAHREERDRRPLVSITMATYNRAPFIREAIASVLAQSYATWELIVVDDGSTDETGEIVRSFADLRIRYVRHAQNLGIAASRSDGLAASSGAYLAVLDSDDVWSDPRKLETQVAFLEHHPDHAIVGTFIELIDSTGEKIGTAEYSTDDQSIRRRILVRNQFAHSSVLMRASIAVQAGGYGSMQIGEDLDLFLRLGMLGEFANIPSYMTLYRVHDGGISKNAPLIAMAVHRSVWKYRSSYPNLFPALIKSLARIVLANLADTRTFRSVRR